MVMGLIAGLIGALVAIEVFLIGVSALVRLFGRVAR